MRPAPSKPVATRFGMAWRLRDLRGMESACGKAERVDPHGLETGLMRVRFLSSAGRMAEARARFARLSEIWPDHVDVWLERARLAGLEGRPGEARAALTRIIRSYPGHAAARKMLENMAR